MKCQECELLLAQNENDTEVDAHLAGCPGCRSLSDELRSNAHAMSAMSEEIIPVAPVRLPALQPWWRWTSAAASVIITLGAAWMVSRPPKPPHIASIDVNVTGILPKAEVPYVKAEIPTKLTPAILPAANTEPLRVKMLTPDPDVVIYWLVD
ncbi:MAG: anti-sigma factor family protein [Bryobacteraceae bacterium]